MSVIYLSTTQPDVMSVLESHCFSCGWMSINPNNRLDNSSKISSDEDNLVVVLKQTPKIIKMIKELSPNTILVGFKLLENVTKEHLITIATNLMNKNKCDYVIANDLKNIKNGSHKALLLNKNNDNIIEINGKTEIANVLANKICD